LAALHEHAWNRAQAAEALGINRATLMEETESLRYQGSWLVVHCTTMNVT